MRDRQIKRAIESCCERKIQASSIRSSTIGQSDLPSVISGSFSVFVSSLLFF